MEFIQARYYTKTKSRNVDLLVVHTMESAEKPDTAESVARWFAGPTSPRASAHYCIDNNSIVQCVRDNDVAWHAPGANHNGLGLEHAGTAKQKDVDWQDGYSQQMLSMSATLAASLCNKYSIPAEFVDPLGLKQGKRGITTHKAVSDAFRKSDHWDPGPGFPMAAYIAMIRNMIDPEPIKPPSQEGVIVVNRPPIKILSHSSWNGGYLVVTDDGGVFSFGDAPFFGSLGGITLNDPIVDAETAPTGQGYWLMGADGGIFGFGDAAFKGRVEYAG